MGRRRERRNRRLPYCRAPSAESGTHCDHRRGGRLAPAKSRKLAEDAAEHWAREQKLLLVYLETAQNNTAAQAFYEARGFRKVDSVANYYSDGTPAWVMLKWVKGKEAAGV